MLKNVMGRLGDIEITRIFDSNLVGETMQTWFPKFDREAVRTHEHWLCPDHYNPESGHFDIPVCSWLFRIQGYNVLIDTCIGNHKTRPGINEMHMLGTRYMDRFRASGVKPEEVDFVLCSHLHLDHVGWNTNLEGGKWVPTFPNAKYVFSKTEYAAAEAQANDPKSPPLFKHIFEDSIYPVVAAGKVLFVDGIHEVLQGLMLRPAPGHSPEHVRIELESAGKRGVFTGDLLHSPVQVPFWEWSTRVCWNPEMAATSRRHLLEFCASEDALLLPTHFVSPHVGRIREDGDTFKIEFGW